ncbi:MAG: hypothetical protein ACOC40_00850 [Thermoplasmatota archaeon]
MGKVKKSITFILALIIILSGSAFIFTETVEGSVYSDDDGVSADVELQYTRDYTFDLSFYSGDNDTGGGWTPPGSTSIGMTSTNGHYAEQVWRKSGVNVECGGIKEVSCHLDIDLRTGGYYSFKITPEGHAYQFEIEQTKDLSSNTVGITIDESYGPDSSLTCDTYNFFFEDNTWRVKVVSEDSDEYDDRIKVNSAELTITTCSSPGMTDTDGDGYDDGEEINTHNTDPVDEDMDNDGWYDGYKNEGVGLFLDSITRYDGTEPTDQVKVILNDELKYPSGIDSWYIDAGTPETTKEYFSGNPVRLLNTRVATDNNNQFHTDIDLMVNGLLVEETPSANDYIGLDWSGSDDYTLDFTEDGVDYQLKFISQTAGFADPNPKNADADSDNDGLTDAEEYQMSDDMVDGRADPWRKDIFVEVDWMSGHKMMNEARWKVASQFREHNIWLHIDDGCMGGGEEINHIEKIATASDTYTDIDDLKSNYFDNNREGKFHYCVFGHYTYASDEEKHLGVADGADFIVGDKLIDERDSMQDWLSVVGLAGALAEYITDGMVSEYKSIRQAGVFMHELGHTLDLDHPTPPFKETHSWIPGISELPSGFGPLDEYTCMNYWYILGKVRYTNSEWGDLDISEEV